MFEMVGAVDDQYSGCAVRFHHVLGHRVGSSQGPRVAITGRRAGPRR